MKLFSLIGMTGCGKTTVGQILAKKFDLAFVDVDAVVVETQKMSIPDIFEKYGELYFRKIENICLENKISEYQKKNESAIFSCGGGIVTYRPNFTLLKNHTTVIWIRRTLRSITADSSILRRPPINGSIVKYQRLYGQREPLYRSLCNFEVINIFPQKAAVSAIKIIKEVLTK